MYIPWKYFWKQYNGLLMIILGNCIYFIFVAFGVMALQSSDIFEFAVYGMALLLPSLYDCSCNYFFKRKSWLFQQPSSYSLLARNFLKILYTMYGSLALLYALLGFFVDPYPTALVIYVACYCCIVPLVIWLTIRFGKKGRFLVIPFMILAYMNHFYFLYDSDIFFRVEILLPLFIFVGILAVYFTRKIIQSHEYR